MGQVRQRTLGDHSGGLFWELGNELWGISKWGIPRGSACGTNQSFQRSYSQSRSKCKIDRNRRGRRFLSGLECNPANLIRVLRLPLHAFRRHG